MENKEVATVRKITGELIGGFILYGIVFSILYSLIYAVITTRIPGDSLILIAIITIVLQGITEFCIWRCSIATTFKKRLIETNDVKTVIKNLMIFTVIMFCITTVMNFSEVNKTVDKMINSNSSVMMSETYIKYSQNSEKIAQYEAKKEKVINKAKTEIYTYLAVLEIGLLVVYLGVVLLQKKAILKHAV